MAGKFYTDFSKKNIEKHLDCLQHEISSLHYTHPVRNLLTNAITDFRNNKFSYDGATFVKERYKFTHFEVAAFIHDWRNSKGYVSKQIDNELFSIMIVLNYAPKLFFWRMFLTKFTFLNVIRHKLKGTYLNEVPNNLYVLN